MLRSGKAEVHCNKAENVIPVTDKEKKNSYRGKTTQTKGSLVRHYAESSLRNEFGEKRQLKFCLHSAAVNDNVSFGIMMGE